MYEHLPVNLIRLAESCPEPIYVVGGAVRDFLCGYPISEHSDWDICSPCSEDVFLSTALRCWFEPLAVYRNTGTVKLKDATGLDYEFSRFRSDKYVRGMHVPSSVTFTADIAVDARRRDFTMNAVYYDVKRREFIDPLRGIQDIKDKRIRTVPDAERVFSEDGLRLLRFARFAGELGFKPNFDSKEMAGVFSPLVMNLTPERVWTELNLILRADLKHGVTDGHFIALNLLNETNVLHFLIPELTLGKGMKQRADFHNYDVLTHSLQCARYAPPELRLAALLHDIGKPFCYQRDKNFYLHATEGAKIARTVLERLKAPKKQVDETVFLVEQHMRDYNLQMKESKIRRELLEQYERLPALFALKQADFSACKDDLSPAPVVVKWQNILQKMKDEGVPFCLRELAVNGKDVQHAGVRRVHTSAVLRELLLFCAEDGKRNNADTLITHVKKTYKGEMPWI